MSPEEFRRGGYQVIDLIADCLSEPTAFPVLSTKRPGEIAAVLDVGLPTGPTDFQTLLEDFRDDIIPGITHWNHPGFFAYFGISGSGPGILAETLIAALNVNAMLWRTSPAATELEELATNWLRQMVGLPDTFAGHIQDSASTSTLVALAAAREATNLDIRRRGLGEGLPKLTLYTSVEGHSSIEKAAITLGLGSDNLRRIRTTGEMSLDTDQLVDAIEADLALGFKPFCVVGTVGTTSTTSVDPIAKIADICDKYGLWNHVDAAYGGAAAVLPERRHLMKGWDRADSIVINPHKWFFVPLDCSVLFLRDPEITRRAFSLVPDYLATPVGASVTNLMDFGPALGRRFRALKLWMVLRYFGQAGFTEIIGEHHRLANELAAWVSADPEWQIATPILFSTVCLCYRPADQSPEQIDQLNQLIVDHVNASGEAFIAPTKVHGRVFIRVAIGNIKTTEQHVARLWELLREAAKS